MSTKTQIQTQIDSIATGVLNPASTVRSVLGTHPDSLLESLYADNIQETKATESILTTVSADIDFTANITKVGRIITVNGFITNNTSNVIAPYLNVTDNDYKCKEDVVFYGLGSIGIESIRVSVTNITSPIVSSRISFGTIITPGESIKFSVSYASNL